MSHIHCAAESALPPWKSLPLFPWTFFCCLDNPVVSSMIITPYSHPSISQIEKSFKKTEHTLIYFCFHTQYASNADGIEYFSFNTSSFAKIISLLQFFSSSSTWISYPFICHSTWLKICFAAGSFFDTDRRKPDGLAVLDHFLLTQPAFQIRQFV